MKAATEYFTAGAPTREHAFEILQQLLGPDLAEFDCLPRNLSPMVPMTRMWTHCSNVLASRALA
eukprot:7450363-Karenia_brevis.AAC.1